MVKNNPRMSDQAVMDATGQDWQAWFRLIDQHDGMNLTHQEIVAVLKETRNLSSWWQQSITVEFEKARGKRKAHEMADGFQISRSKTISADANSLFEAWMNPEIRKRWLNNPNFTVRTATEPKSLRITWADGDSQVNVYLYPKKDKTRVSINHGKLPNATRAAEMKAYWSIQLEQLAELF